MNLLKTENKVRITSGQKNRRSDSQFIRSILPLNIAQLLGALNDNIFKFLCAFFLIDLYGIARSSEVMIWIGAIYVLPFILFSTYGGALADRYSKQKLVIGLKGLEVLVMGFGIWAYSMKSPWGCFILLFLMSFQSALFGPPKYGIIPELVEEQHISKANGLITASTYISIIAGSFLATFLTQISNRNFVFGAIICTLIAVVGFVASFYVPKTKPMKNKRKMATFAIADVTRTLSYCKPFPFLVLTIFASSFFLFLGGFIQLNIVPYAISTLNIGEVGGVYLFSTCSIGIVLGAYVSGKINRKSINLGLACLASLGISLFFILIPAISFSVIGTAIVLSCLGFAGGLYIVPIESYMQSKSPEEKRGQIIATNSFLSFCGVLFAPAFLYLFSSVLNISASLGFICMGLINFIFFLYLSRQLSGPFFNYFSRKFICPFYQIKINPQTFDLKHAQGVVLHMRRLAHLLLLFAFSNKIHLYIVRERPKIFDFFFRIFKNIHFIYAHNSFLIASNIFKYVVESNNRNEQLPCLIIPHSIVNKYYGEDDYVKGLSLIRNKCDFITIQKNMSFKPSFKKPLKRTQISIAFDPKLIVRSSKPDYAFKS
ncbi:MAG: MFS transporter [Simkaniaceae bacterium]|nr:MFS transporter [Simkaniaceae bacterium]MCF7851829.1 MFS transporter [Simkaniaceae bacterium]